MPNADSAPIRESAGQLRRRRSIGRFMQWDTGLDDDLVERIWRNPQALLAEGRRLQDKPSCKVVCIDEATGSLVWKHHTWRRFPHVRRALKWSLLRSPARKAWIDGCFLHTAGVPTPCPRVYVERGFGPFATCSYVMTDYVAGTSLYRLMRFGRPTEKDVRQLAQQVATIWQQLDELRVVHSDFKTENLLVDPQGKVWLIDLDRMRRYRRVDSARRRQAQDIRDLLHPRNWRSDPAAAELFRLAILQSPAAKAILAGPHTAGHPLSQPVSPTNRPSQLVTVLIPCLNAADTIVACLDSVRDMADEILVADAGSSDATLRLAREFGGCKIIQRRSTNAASFAAWAHDHARHPWILRILPDERLNPELGRQVQDVLATEPTEDGFYISRTIYFQGQPFRKHRLERGSSIRLYRKAAGRYEMRDGRVEVTVGSHRVGRFASRLIHESCPSTAGHPSEEQRPAA